MSNANSLELLPPRQPAQSASSSSQNDRSKKSDSSDSSDQTDTKFKTKLAKKLNALQKPATPATDKSAKPAQGPGTDPSNQDQSADNTAAEDAKTLADQAKAKTSVPLKAKPTNPLADADQPAADKATKPAQPAADVPTQADQTVVKKPADHKTASTAAKSPTVDPNAAAKLASASNTSQAPAQSPKSSDGDSDSDAVDGITPATPNLYGSGKVVAKAATDGNAAGAGSTTAEAQAADVQAASAATDDPAELAAAGVAIDEPVVKPAAPANDPDGTNSVASALDGTAKNPAGSAPLKSSSVVEPTPQARFVEANQPKIVSSIQGQLLPHGGTMQIRLDPPELGPMQVSVHMKDGVMTASFETTSEHATKLLSHTLSQLKSGLEAAGMNVEKLQVQQSSKKEGQSSSNGDSGNAPQEQQQQAQQEKQRREMVQRMWQKLAGGDPLDLVA